MFVNFRAPSYFPLYRVLGLLGAYAVPAAATVPVCRSSIYCQGDILHRIQMAQIFNDSKTFVDLRMVNSYDQIVQDFDSLLKRTGGNPTRMDLITFVDINFSSELELEKWEPRDFIPDPPVLEKISDITLRKFARDVIHVWPTLGRRVSQDVHDNPTNYSLLYVPNGFVVPGGRFKELYYWDTYWVVKGLLISGMKETSRGIIENLLHLVKTIGYVPNGSRIYYLGRSQPPMLAKMVESYVHATKNLTWLADHIEILEQELRYWLDHKTVDVQLDGKKYTMLHYQAHGTGPRPESYREDFLNANLLEKDARGKFYMELKSAAESGWDFSSRWLLPTEGEQPPSSRLVDVFASRIIPVDLNSIFAGALYITGNLRSLLNDQEAAQMWWSIAKYWRAGIYEVLWHEKDGIWYDYDIDKQQHRRMFYPSCAAPLWAGAVEEIDKMRYGARLAKYLLKTGALNFPGGVPSSLIHSGEQWDFPNAWPPMQSIVIQALDKSGYREAQKLSLEQAQRWVRSNYLGYRNGSKMYEKYDVLVPGRKGEGGEYVVQDGFGWTNGVVLELLNRYGDKLTVRDKY